MKVKRHKRVQRLLNFYRHNYGLVPPYRLLIDGTFAAAALEQHVNIREQVCKYIGDAVHFATTDCVVG
jgi:U3 small nucleolar RNA-associated protein 23